MNAIFISNTLKKQKKDLLNSLFCVKIEKLTLIFLSLLDLAEKGNLKQKCIIIGNFQINKIPN